VERVQRFPNRDETALFLNSHGQRLSIRSIDLTLRGWVKRLMLRSPDTGFGTSV
jgi:site-specific recombinase XerC